MDADDCTKACGISTLFRHTELVNASRSLLRAMGEGDCVDRMEQEDREEAERWKREWERESRKYGTAAFGFPASAVPDDDDVLDGGVLGAGGGSTLLRRVVFLWCTIIAIYVMVALVLILSGGSGE